MIKNTHESSGSVSKWLHWLTAFWILAAYVSILYLDWALHGKGPLRSPILRIHKGIGFSVLVFLALRLYWRATNPNPALPRSMPRWQVSASHASHSLLYHYVEKDNVLQRMLPGKS